MIRPTTQQAILRRHACRSLLVASWALRFGLALDRASGRMLDRLEALARRQRQHASDLAVLGGLSPVPEGLRQR